MNPYNHPAQFHATTILGVKRKNEIAMGGVGQVTLGETIMKEKARKVRKMYNDTILAGFAGAAAGTSPVHEVYFLPRRRLRCR